MIRKTLRFLNYFTVPWIVYIGSAWLVASIIAKTPLNIAYIAVPVTMGLLLALPFQQNGFHNERKDDS